ncbi:OPT oligopeptide transporter [Lactarius quietus]|nr:OPT oligopeptide transporter [Lactarius quietus]
MSLSDDEKRSVDLEKRDSEHLGSTQDINSDDPNFDPTAFALEDESPYPEVRSAVANTDDPTMPVSTFRAWVMGLLWAILIPGVNQFFFFRYPSVTITQLLSFPICKAWARYFPNVTLFGVDINPGPFTIKEHVIVTIMAGVGAQSAYATDIVAVQKVFYNQHTNFGYQWLLVMSTQLIGFSIGGICKRFLVAPPSMIWPVNLVTAALFNTLHAQETAGTQARGGISRERFFLYVFISAILPVNQLFGVTHGLSMGILTFDWGQITFNGSPLPVPWWAAANIGATVVFFYWFIVPILYYTNVWYSGFLPLVSDHSFDNTGQRYNVTRIINEDASFNLEAYKAYSPLFISVSFAVAYGLSFASVTATLTHIFLYYRKQIWIQARRSLAEQPDIHARLMSVYKEVPDWWYISIFLSMFVFGVVAIEVWNTQFPVWAFVLALLICASPNTCYTFYTNQQVGLNVITELIIGYALPGRPIAMMIQDLGLHHHGPSFTVYQRLQARHYMKIPHRPMFFCQVVATMLAGTVQLAVQAWLFSNVEDLCSSTQKDGFTCPNTTVFGTASIIWGVIGPRRLFSHGQLYYGLVFFFLAGALLPLCQWVLHKKFKFGFLKYVNFPLIFTGTGNLPPATPLNYVPWVLICFVFNYVIRRRHFGWCVKVQL